MSKAEDILERLKRSFNNLVTKDDRAKVVLICILISTTFWFFNALNKSDYVTRINYPITLNYDDAEYIATRELPDRVTVEVSGGGWDLMARYFGFKMTELPIEVANPKEGYMLTNALRAQISEELEPISINYFLDDSIVYHIDKLATKEVLLAYDTSAIDLEVDYIRTSAIEITPQTIQVEGPASTLSDMPNTLFLNENLENINEDFTDEIDLPDLPELVVPEVNSVEVSFNVVPLFEIDLDLPIEMRNFPDELWQLDINRSEVLYKVPETQFDVTDTSQIKLFVDFNKLLPDSTLIIESEVLNENFREIRVQKDRVKAFKDE